MNSKVLLACAGAALLTACAHNRSQTINEPSGAATHNDVEGLMPRDLNQQPYPGLHPNYDEWWEINPRAPSLGPSPEEDVKMAKPEETQDEGSKENKNQNQP